MFRRRVGLVEALNLYRTLRVEIHFYTWLYQLNTQTAEYITEHLFVHGATNYPANSQIENETYGQLLKLTIIQKDSSAAIIGSNNYIIRHKNASDARMINW